MNESLKGRLLVANPTMGDPNFARTVVLLLEHGEGAVGVVLNRPSDTEVEGPLPGWGAAAAPPALVFVGGPVAPTGAICLARVGLEGASEGWQPVAGGLGMIDLGRDPDEVLRSVEAIRVFVGHAGWMPGQLEAEIAAGGWYVVDSDPLDALSPVPGELWRAVLRRQGGRLALVAGFPPNPSVN